MHMINWWWRTQDQVFSRATVVSLIITTDKTVLIQHHDDLKTWLIYLMIENLKREIRKNQTRFVNLFLKFISIAKKNVEKTIVWYKILSIMLKCKRLTRFQDFAVEQVRRIKIFNLRITIKKNSINEMFMKCVDDYIQKCFFIIATFVCDYKKQMIITSVKFNQHYMICQVLSNAREDLIHW